MNNQTFRSFRSISTIGLLCIFIFSFPLSAQKYHIKNYTIDDGLPGSLILDINQDSDGIIWIATFGGLTRFDGVSFTNFFTSHGLPVNGIRNLLFDQQKMLWLGTDVGITKFDGKNFRSFNADSGVAKGIVWSSASDQNGNYWFGTQDGGLTFFNGKTFRTFTTADGLPSNFIYHVFIDSKNRLWVGYRDKGFSIHKINSDGNLLSSEFFGSAEKLPNLVIRAIVEDKNGNFFIGTRGGGLVTLSKGKLSFFNQNDGLSGNDIYALTMTPKGDIAVGTYGAGIDFFTPHISGNNIILSNKKHIGKKNGLLMDNILKLFYDREGNLWVAMANGISKVLSTDLESYTEHEGLIDNLIYSLWADDNGEIWLGSTIGLSRLSIKNGQSSFSMLTTSDGLPSNEIRAILRDSNGSLWIGTSSGLVRSVNNRLTIFTKKDGLTGDYIVDLMEDKSGVLWVCTNQGVSTFSINDKKPNMKNYTIDNGLSSSIIYSTYQMSNGDIYLASSNGGIDIISSTGIRHITKQQRLPGNNIRSFHEDGYGQIWVATSGNGIARLTTKPDRLIIDAFDIRDGISSNTIVTITEDANGYLWLGGNSGIDKIDPLYYRDKNNKHKLVVQHIDKKMGVIGNEVTTSNAAISDHEGNLWFGFVEGVSKVNPNHFVVRQFIPETNLNRVSINDSISYLKPFYIADDAKKISFCSDSIPVFDYNQNHFKFYFSGQSYIDEKSIRYKYRLLGYDTTWSKETNVSFKEFTNLNDGDYTFEVVSANPEGEWDQTPARFRFILLPPFWKTVWFLSIIGVLGFGFIYLGYSLRTQVILRQKNQLEKTVLERTQELSIYSQKLESANDDLTKLNQLKTELLSIAAHDLKNPLTTILNYAELITTENDNPSKIVKWSKNISDISNQMIHIIDGILDMAAIESGQMILHKEMVNLKRIIESVIYAQLVYAQSKNLTLNFAYDAQEEFTAFVDKIKIKEIVENLLTNAIKFSPSGKTIRVSLNKIHNEIVLKISDEGPGFTAEDKEKIFGRFQRLSARPTAGETSIGLGLSIVKQLIELHGGSIVLDSNPGEGAVFTVMLPENGE